MTNAATGKTNTVSERAKSVAKSKVESGDAFDAMTLEATEALVRYAGRILQLAGSQDDRAFQTLAQRVRASGTVIALEVSGQKRLDAGDFASRALAVAEDAAERYGEPNGQRLDGERSAHSFLIASGAVELLSNDFGLQRDDLNAGSMIAAEASPRQLAEFLVAEVAPAEFGEFLAAEAAPEALQQFLAAEAEFSDLIAYTNGISKEEMAEYLAQNLPTEDLAVLVVEHTTTADKAEFIAAEAAPSELAQFLVQTLPTEFTTEFLAAETDRPTLASAVASIPPRESVAQFVAAEMSPEALKNHSGTLEEAIAKYVDALDSAAFLLSSIPPDGVAKILPDLVDPVEMGDFLAAETSPSAIASFFAKQIGAGDLGGFFAAKTDNLEIAAAMEKSFDSAEIADFAFAEMTPAQLGQLGALTIAPSTFAEALEEIGAPNLGDFIAAETDPIAIADFLSVEATPPKAEEFSPDNWLKKAGVSAPDELLAAAARLAPPPKDSASQAMAALSVCRTALKLTAL